MLKIYNVYKKAILLHHLKRSMFYWINVQFNVVDVERTKKFGPDRTCAEWILRNGGKIRWVDPPDIVKDYTKLPKEGTILHLKEIDATNTGVMFNGFAHLKGCKYITKIILDRCDQLESLALGELIYVKNTLEFLQVSSCPNIRDDGLLTLKVLTNLKNLVLFDLNVVNMNKVVATLKESLPQCNIKVDE